MHHWNRKRKVIRVCEDPLRSAVVAEGEHGHNTSEFIHTWSRKVTIIIGFVLERHEGGISSAFGEQEVYHVRRVLIGVGHTGLDQADTGFRDLEVRVQDSF